MNDKDDGLVVVAHASSMEWRVNQLMSQAQYAELYGKVKVEWDIPLCTIENARDIAARARREGMEACAKACENQLAYNPDDPGETYAAVCRALAEKDVSSSPLPDAVSGHQHK